MAILDIDATAKEHTTSSFFLTSIVLVSTVAQVKNGFPNVALTCINLAMARAKTPHVSRSGLLVKKFSEDGFYPMRRTGLTVLPSSLSLKASPISANG